SLEGTFYYCPQFSRHAGQRNDASASEFKYHRWRCSHRILDRESAFGQSSHFQPRIAHFRARHVAFRSELMIAAGNDPLRGFVHLEPEVSELRDSRESKVIISRAEAATREDQVCAARDLSAPLLGYVVDFVAHDGYVSHAPAHASNYTAEVIRIRVFDESKQDLVSDREDLDVYHASI